jgi:signal transduction histidine kinase
MEYEVEAPDPVPELPLSGDVRRSIYLVFKEAISNAVVHSGARRVRVGLSCQDGMLELAVSDDGRGLPTGSDAAQPSRRGHGLRNMRLRAGEIGAEFGIRSSAGDGTTIWMKQRIAQPGH